MFQNVIQPDSGCIVKAWFSGMWTQQLFQIRLLKRILHDAKKRAFPAARSGLESVVTWTWWVQSYFRYHMIRRVCILALTCVRWSFQFTFNCIQWVQWVVFVRLSSCWSARCINVLPIQVHVRARSRPWSPRRSQCMWNARSCHRTIPHHAPGNVTIRKVFHSSLANSEISCHTYKHNWITCNCFHFQHEAFLQKSCSYLL